MALNDEFESMQAALLHRDPLPHLELVASKLLLEQIPLATTLKAKCVILLVSTPKDVVLATFGFSSCASLTVHIVVHMVIVHPVVISWNLGNLREGTTYPGLEVHMHVYPSLLLPLWIPLIVHLLFYH